MSRETGRDENRTNQPLSKNEGELRLPNFTLKDVNREGWKSIRQHNKSLNNMSLAGLKIKLPGNLNAVFPAAQVSRHHDLSVPEQVHN